MLNLRMANVQLKNLSDDLHQQLRDAAAETHTTISDLVRVAIERELARRRWQSTFSTRARTDLQTSAAELLQEARDERGDDS